MINHFPSSGFEVTHPSSNQLTVICHYAWWYVIFAIVLFGLPALRNLLKGFKTQQAQPIWWALILAILCAAAISFFPTGTATFDKDRGTVAFQKRGFLFIQHRYEYPLGDVRYATLETATADRRFVVVFKGGGRMGLSAFTSQGGQSQAVDAVNEFLGVNPVP
jgi:hypothetical protein